VESLLEQITPNRIFSMADFGKEWYQKKGSETRILRNE
jgi:hypothetical protein